MTMSSLPIVAGTLQTDPRSGGIKRSSGVVVLPSVAEAWAEVRDDSIPSVDWIIVGYDGGSKTDITLLDKGNGGMTACSAALPEGRPVFGGCRKENGRFVTFFYTGEETPPMQRGRASMHKNGVLNVLEGSDGEVDIKRGKTEQETLLPGNGESPASTTVAGATDLPQGVNPLNKEQSLSEEEFVAVFGMDKASFQRLPAWKRTSLKKNHGLF